MKWSRTTACDATAAADACPRCHGDNSEGWALCKACAAVEPYAVDSLVQLAHTCCGGVPGTVETYELIRTAREWNPGDHDRYRYVVRWQNYPGGVLFYTSSELKPWKDDEPMGDVPEPSDEEKKKAEDAVKDWLKKQGYPTPDPKDQ